MRGLRLFAGTMLGVLAAPALAQSPALPDVPSFCSATTAFGQTMGSSTVANMQSQPVGNSTFGRLPAQFAPFDNAEILMTRHSRQINRVTASMKTGSAQDAARLAEEIRAQFRRAGWIEAGGSSATKQGYDPVGDDVADFNSEPGGLAAAPTGRRADIGAIGSEVSVACIDLPGFVKHVKEAFGPPPVGTDRPSPPQLPAGQITLDCTLPLSETERAFANDEQKMMEWMARYKATNDYFEQLQEWSGQQFVKAGKWTEQQKNDFEIKLLSRPELAESWGYFINAPLRVITHLSAIGGGTKAKNDAAVCRAFNALFADVAEHGRRTLAHTDAIDRIYRAEAAKIGLSLD